MRVSSSKRSIYFAVSGVSEEGRFIINLKEAVRGSVVCSLVPFVHVWQCPAQNVVARRYLMRNAGEHLLYVFAAFPVAPAFALR